MKICSWNVNGIRAVLNKGFLAWMLEEAPDILCLQETKASPDQLRSELLDVPGYFSYWNHGERKGYSGVATYVRHQPTRVDTCTGIQILDVEGRLIISEHPEFTLLNIYFPNGQMNDDRLQYKLRFYKALMDFCEALHKREPRVIICGDFNTAHREIDLKNPKSNEKRSGFLPVERELLDQFHKRGFVDIFRRLYPEKVQYSWWDYRTRARERNAGWRIDCFYATEEVVPLVSDCRILEHVQGSDHCPIVLELL